MYTRAIQLDDTRAEYFTYRAHTLQKLERHAESRSDAQRAVELSPLDPKANLRLGIASFHLEQYEEALVAFNASLKFGGILVLANWNIQIYNLSFTAGSDAAIRQWIAWTEEKLAKIQKPSAMPVSPLVQEAKPASIKHDWYQTESHVCVTVLAKNLNPAAVKVEFTPLTVSLFLHIPPFCHFK